MTLVEGPDSVAALDIAPDEKVVWLSQTTLSVDETMETVGALRELVPGLVSPPSDDICYATQNRQIAVKQVAPRSDVLIVVGSANSSNSVRLLEVGLQHGAKSGHRVDLASELEPGWFDGAVTVGVTSGASVPEILVRDVLARLAELGFGDVEVVDAVEEHMVFALPQELRRDLKAAGKQ
jgi:4-hydroxy-3-methylbut-2-enyl diphosphate reductase